jgi:amino acid adenylation domain-containing protein
MATEDRRSVAADCGQDVPGWTPFPRGELEETVSARFARIAAANARRVAVVSRTARATYGDLRCEAGRIAAAIERAAAGRDGAVATVLDSDIPLTAAMLGIFATGRRYVPLDAGSPVPRAAAMLEAADAAVVLTDRRYEGHARAIAGPRQAILDVEAARAAEASDPPRSFPTDTALWVMHTSGSTGEPKGVVQTHRNLLHYIRNYANGLRLGPDDRLLTLMRITVNGGCHDALMALLTGGTLLLWDAKRDGLHPLPEWIARQGATILSAAPTVFRHLVAELLPDQRLPTLRMLKLWAEPSYRRDFDAFRRHFRDDAVLLNRLGSNEQGSTLWHFLRKDTAFDGSSVPVGYPPEDNAVRLVGDDGRDVPDGEIGEILACSRYLSPGYWKRDDLTRAAFSNDPGDAAVRRYRTGDLGYRRPDGCIVCVGRKDGQVKVRGYRVETAEIEQALLAHPDVAEAVVIARADPRMQGEQRLLAYFTAKRDTAGLAMALRALVRSRLPDYMWPVAFVRMDRLPQAENGKIARRALPDPGHPRPELAVAYRAATSKTERTLRQLWLDVLRLDDAGVDDAFLDLGGDSLQAAQIVSRVRARFGAEVSIAELLATGTIAGMARLLERPMTS